MSITYLDNAATTFPKPRCVCDEVSRCIKSYCGNPGRSAHPLAVASANKIYECREHVARFFASESPENVIFTMNTTYALNMAIKGILRRGDHVIISDMEHNSVYRPIERLSHDGIITYSIFKTVKDGSPLSDEQIIKSIKKLIRPYKTKMLICSHVPNLISATRPISEIGKLCRESGIIFVLDAAQSAGHIPINIAEARVDVLCAPAHKGLYGVQGCGFMLLGDGMSVKPMFEGGNGISSLEWEMPDMPPERFESGTLPTPCIAGLSEGISYLSKLSFDEITAHESAMFNRTCDMLLNSPELRSTVYIPEVAGSVLLFNLDGIPPETAGRYLGQRGICVRSGYHCSALGHKALGTEETGAIRVSFGIFNTQYHVELLISALKELREEIKA